ncbi:FAD-binding oxidoreductase [Amycolatopsis silviterrae]|uniref:FAD-binding oxidoreductase n=1 Tax=Amycolatopsis silviterrae TaxID=1656914 RepID=A0ABW5H417_9PSEU
MSTSETGRCAARGRLVADGLGLGFSGAVHVPGSARYDALRRPWRREIDQRPLVVAEAATAQDVRAAVRTARDHELPFAVQSTGHGTVRPCDGGLLLATPRLNHIDIDPSRRVARVGAGALWGDVVAAAAKVGLAPLSGYCPEVGVAGYTLGGGSGWLSRKHGYAADSLLRAEVVTADGDVLTADASQNAELFWALRGGGGNFGVVTELSMRLYAVSRVYAGLKFFDGGNAGTLLRTYRDWAATEPDDLSTSVFLLTLPPEVPAPLGGKQVVCVGACSLAAPAVTEQWLAPLWAAGGRPLTGELGPMTYPELLRMFGPPEPSQAARERIDMFTELSDPVVAALTGDLVDASTAVNIRHWGGAMARPDAGAGPVGHRDVPFSVLLKSAATSSRIGDLMLANELAPHRTGGAVLNFLTDPRLTATAYTREDYRRLTALKRRHDPGNLLGHNHNIPPG